jgi:hypothetical protein
VTFIGERILFPAHGVFYIERNEQEYLVAVCEKRVRVEVLEPESGQVSKNAGYSWRRDAAATTEQQRSTSHSMHGCNLSMIARGVSATERLIDVLDGIDVAHN